MSTRLDNSVLAEHGIDGILKILADSTAAEYEIGRHWYRRANRFAAKVAALTGKRPATVAAVLARLSPQITWADNRAACLAVCAGIDSATLDQCYPDNIRRAERIAAEDTDEVIAAEVLPRKGYARPKISAFFHNIANPEIDGIATVDTWAIRIWLGDCMGDAYRVTAKQSRKIQADYIAAGRIAGLLSHELQAIVWVAAHRLAKEGLQRSLFDIGIGLSFKI